MTNAPNLADPMEVIAPPFQAPDGAADAPGGDPPWLSAMWRRVALGAVMALAAILDFYALSQEGYANSYYAATVKSMLQSWHNFFYVSFDSGGFVTVDKPPLGFWIQAISAKIFGFSGFSLLLPEALAGVLSVGLLYIIVRRFFGSLPALLAALALAITPISVVTNRNNTIDSLLVLCSLAAAWATLRAAERGSFRWLALAGLLVGVGFNIKMLEAYLVLPALIAVYLFAAPLSWRARIAHLLGFAGIMLVVSFAWVTAVDLTPAALRPWVGSTSTNSELDLALGYNGIERLLGMGGSVSSLLSGSSSVGGPGGASENGPAGVFRLFNTQLGGQASWLLPLGLVGLLASGWAYRLGGLARDLPQRLRLWRASPEARRDAHLSMRQASWVLWGVWTLVMGVFFSVAGFYHTYYLSMLAPGVAALAAIGASELWADYQRPIWQGWLLPAALLVTAAIQAYILASFPAYASWMTPVILVVALLAAAILGIRRAATLGLITLPAWAGGWTPTPVLPRAALGLALAALLLPSLVWSGVSVAQGAGGTLPHAGPTAAVNTLGGSGATFGGPRGDFSGGQGGFPGGYDFSGPPPDLPGGQPGALPEGFGGGFPGRQGNGGLGGVSANSALIAYLEAHQGSAKYLVATMSANQAAPIILATGKAVMALGGFGGSDPILTVAQLAKLIDSGQVRYFLLEGAGGSSARSTGNNLLVNWVTANCKAVSSSAAGTSGLYVCGS
ncbi:MAG TPA: glycosyltransferase family 39 protein [Ktedonobacterales bacterium]